MILQSIKLNPFAGTVDREIKFDRGLNIILGPNEAGKSTLVNALKLVLFSKTKLTDHQTQRTIGKYLPITGGDTVIVKLGFTSGTEGFTLEKSWGGTRSSKLTLPEGGLVTNDATVEQEISEKLELKEGTYNSVLIAYQAALPSTITSLIENWETSADLIAILRTAIQETDGISIERLSALIDSKYEDFFKRWDEENDTPESTRRYSKGVGNILRNYYLVSDLEERIEEHENIESKAEKFKEKLQKTQNLLLRETRKQEKNISLEKEVRKSIEYLNEKKKIEIDLRQYRKVIREWPKTLNQIDSLLTELEEGRKEEGKVNKEYIESREFDKIKNQIEIFNRAKQIKKIIDKAESQYLKIKKISTTEYTEIKSKVQQLHDQKTSLAAGKLTVSMIPKRDLKIDTTIDFQESKTIELSKGKTHSILAGGRIIISNSSMDINIKSGDIPIDEITKEINKIEKWISSEYSKHGVENFKQLEKLYAKNTKLQNEIEKSKENFELILEGEDYKELEEIQKKHKSKKSNKETHEISLQLGELKTKNSQLNDQIATKKKKVKEWKEEFGELVEISSKVDQLKNSLNVLKTNLSELGPEIDSIENKEEFLKDFDERRVRINQAKEEEINLKDALADIQRNSDSSSIDELNSELQFAIDQLRQSKLEGNAIAKIKRELLDLKQKSDENTFEPWANKLSKYIKRFTGERYSGVDVIENRTGIVERYDGQEMPFDFLSTGTKSGFGLAIRLVMAEYFLRDKDGFLILDDPLIDLDPNRQKAAVEVIQEFSQEKQMIILTCHPSHAEILEGNLIELK